MRMPELHTIPWHQECLKNQKISLEQKQKQLQRLQEEVNRDQLHIQFYEMQVEAAIKKGKDKFDPDKFMKQRKKE